MASVLQPRLSPGVALPYSDGEGSTTPKPRASSKPKCPSSTKRGTELRDKPAASVRKAAITFKLGTNEGPGNQLPTSGASHGGPSKPEFLEPNYELIHSLASALSKHLKKKKSLTAEKSRDFMVKCVNEIIRICEVCIKKEAKRKEAEGRVKASLDGTTARDNGPNPTPGVNTGMYNVQVEPTAFVPGRKDTSDVPCVEPRSEPGDMHHAQFVGGSLVPVGGPFPKSAPAPPQPMGTGLLSQWFGSINFALGPVQEMNTALQVFWVPESEAYLVW